MRFSKYMGIPYYLWLVIFVIAPLFLLIYQSFFDIEGQLTLANYLQYFTSIDYLIMTISSFVVAALITLFSFILAYPLAYVLARSNHRDYLFLFMVILPTWMNLLLKIYVFIGLLAQNGPIISLLAHLGWGQPQLLFTNFAFILVAVYLELPFMVLPIYNSITEIPSSMEEASSDLGASRLQTLLRVILPMSREGIRSGVQTVFIPSLSLFMLTRLIGGNRVITLGTAVEQHFLVTQNWGMGATIGVILMAVMILVMYLTREKGGSADA
nr:ABC transporter permease [Hutsoniella sourekii]